MPSLRASAGLGNTSTSALLRSASSIQSSINAYNESLASYKYELSPKTDSDLAEYRSFLTSRINTLNSTGNVADASKALTLTRTLTSATRSNASANIQRENIQVMAGNGTLQDKYNTIVDQFTRAMNVGDLSLAQQLESQAYSVSQSIQYQASQAAQAADALKAAGVSSANYEQKGIQDRLDEAVQQLKNGIETGGGEKQAEKYLKAWVDTNRDTLKQLGTVIPNGAQPNYFNILEGIEHAKYNSLVLEAQTKAPTDPNGAQSLMYQAQSLLSGEKSISIAGGAKLNIQEIQQAAQDPMMFAYDYASGGYKRTTQTGYQYLKDSTTGKSYLAPTFSGIVSKDKANQIYFLNPNQTAELNGLGLNFTMNKSGTTGDGVQVQATDNTPDWLKAIIGNRGVTSAFTDKNGNLQFEGPSSTGDGNSYFTLIKIGGHSGVFEHYADGSSKLVGGNYGFDAGAASLLVNAGQMKQQQILLQTQAEQAAQLAKLSIAPLPKVQRITVAPPAAPKTALPQTTAPASTIQPATYNPQPRTVNPQTGGGALPSHVQGVPLTQPHLNSIRL